MNTTLRALTFALAAAAAAQAPAADVRRLTDNGQDGDKRFYDIICSDGWRTKLQVRGRADEANKKMCYTTRAREGRCVDAWNVQEVAAAACE